MLKAAGCGRAFVRHSDGFLLSTRQDAAAASYPVRADPRFRFAPKGAARFRLRYGATRMRDAAPALPLLVHWGTLRRLERPTAGCCLHARAEAEHSQHERVLGPDLSRLALAGGRLQPPSSCLPRTMSVLILPQPALIVTTESAALPGADGVPGDGENQVRRAFGPLHDRPVDRDLGAPPVLRTRVCALLPPLVLTRLRLGRTWGACGAVCSRRRAPRRGHTRRLGPKRAPI